MERATGKRPVQLDVPPLPPLCADVWSIFLQLHSRRSGTGFGPAPLDEARLLAWSQLHARRLTPWEIDCIFALDDAWLSAQSEQQKTDKPKPKNTAN